MEQEQSSTRAEPTESMPPQSRFVYGAVAAIALIGVVVFFVLTSQPGEGPLDTGNDGTSEVTDWTRAVHDDKDYVEAQALTKTGGYDAAVAVLETLKAKTSSINEQSIIDMDIAATLHQKDPIEGATRYAAIANNESYPDITRGTAYLHIYLQYAGTENVELLRPFFTKEEFEKYDSVFPDDLRTEMARRAHRLFPFVTVGIQLARAEFFEYGVEFPKSTDIPVDALNTEAERIYEKYVGLFDSSIAFLERGEGMRQYIPNTYLGKANLLADLAQGGYTFARLDVKEEAKKTYTDALARARAQSATITEQFILAHYSDFLLATGDTAGAESLLNTLVTLPITPMFKGFVLTERARTEIPFFLAHTGKNENLKKYLGL